MSKEDELRDILDETAKYIAQFSSNPRAWHSWLVYLLGSLDQQATDMGASYGESFKEMLSALQDAIRIRQRTGGW